MQPVNLTSTRLEAAKTLQITSIAVFLLISAVAFAILFPEAHSLSSLAQYVTTSPGAPIVLCLTPAGLTSFLTIIISSLVRHRESRRLAAEAKPTKVEVKNTEPSLPQTAPTLPVMQQVKLSAQELTTSYQGIQKALPKALDALGNVIKTLIIARDYCIRGEKVPPEFDINALTLTPNLQAQVDVNTRVIDALKSLMDQCLGNPVGMLVAFIATGKVQIDYDKLKKPPKLEDFKKDFRSYFITKGSDGSLISNFKPLIDDLFDHVADRVQESFDQETYKEFVQSIADNRPSAWNVLAGNEWKQKPDLFMAELFYQQQYSLDLPPFFEKHLSDMLQKLFGYMSDYEICPGLPFYGIDLMDSTLEKIISHYGTSITMKSMRKGAIGTVVSMLISTFGSYLDKKLIKFKGLLEIFGHHFTDQEWNIYAAFNIRTLALDAAGLNPAHKKSLAFKTPLENTFEVLKGSLAGLSDIADKENIFAELPKALEDLENRAQAMNLAVLKMFPSNQ